MKAAYIGILTPGSTSRMRAEVLRRLTPDWTWDWVDTDPPLVSTARAWQTMAFRFNSGKGVNRINNLVIERIRNSRLDLAWVDKAVFLRPETVKSIRTNAKRMVHFTPDTAFHANRSRHFEKTLGMFDLLVTTKSFEMDEYLKRTERDSVLLTTQGYDPTVHYPRNDDSLRKQCVVFVGLAEPDREHCIATMLEGNVPVRLAGRGWQKFLRRWGEHPMLTFEGEDIFADAYASLLSTSWIGLGLLSKRFPELHTTRTFEIPACGAVLATESTSETKRFFGESEALFFANYVELAANARALLSSEDSTLLRETAGAGHKRVLADGRDYPSILARVLSDSRLSL